MVTSVHLLGAAQVLHEGVLYRPLADKRLCLLSYLACAGGFVSRERLAFLFWPDVESDRARTNLRGLLARLKPLPFARGLQADGDRLGWPVQCDVGEFRDAVDARDWERAVALYAGELLAGLAADHSPEFGAWLELERESLHAAWSNAVIARAEELITGGRSGEAAALLERSLRHDEEPTEELLRAYLRAAPLANRTEVALRRYRAYAEWLEREYGVVPLPVTQSLAQALESQVAESAAPHSLPGRLSGAPSFPTPFVGRDPELAEILTLLADPECRLLTLTGPGGIGKTRLAVRAATEAAREYRDGVAFVPLAAVPDSARMVAAIAAVLELPLSGEKAPAQQLFDLLNRRRLLLVLDNFEHLLGSAAVLAELLRDCPEVTMLVTSRRRLRLADEWTYEVAGMNFPRDPAAADQEGFDAVQLFTRTLRRFRPGSGLSPPERAVAARICRLLGGSPLGIELAVGLTRLLPLEVVEEEVARDLDVLTDPLHDLSVERRSLRAVFERSWELLTPEESSALAGLTVFRGGFTREAAETVAATSLRTLLALLDASLLKRRSHGRFDLHELVRQYAAERLEPQQEERLRERHMRYYSTLLADLERPLLGGPDQAAALETLETEIDNAWTAWEFAGERSDATALQASAECLWRYCEIRGHFHSGEAAFLRAAAGVPPGSAAQAKVLARLGALAHRLMHLELSEQVSEQSIAVSHELHLAPEATALINIAVVPLLRGDLQRSTELHQHMLALGEELADPLIETAALSNLADLSIRQGELAYAERLLERSVPLVRGLGDRWAAVFTLGNLGALHLRRGSPATAVELFREALAAARAIRFRLMIGHLLTGLAEAHLTLGDVEAAGAACSEAARVLLELGNLGRDEVESLLTVACFDGQLGRDFEAQTIYREVILRSLEPDRVGDAFEAVLGLARILARRGAVRRALELKYLATQQLADGSEPPDSASNVLLEVEAAVSADDLERVRTRGSLLTLDELLGPQWGRYALFEGSTELGRAQ